MDIGAGDKDLNAQLDALGDEEKKIMAQIVEAQNKATELQKAYDAKYDELEKRKAEPKASKAATVSKRGQPHTPAPSALRIGALTSATKGASTRRGRSLGQPLMAAAAPARRHVARVQRGMHA